MPQHKLTATPAIRMLKAHGVAFTLHPYAYEEKGGTARAARSLGVDEGRVIKTLVMENEKSEPFLVLMHGDRNVSTKALARTLGVKRVRPCHPQSVYRNTGYVVGGVSPFGAKKSLAVFMEESIGGLSTLFINAGKRGLLVQISPLDLERVLNPTTVTVAI